MLSYKFVSNEAIEKGDWTESPYDERVQVDICFARLDRSYKNTQKLLLYLGSIYDINSFKTLIKKLNEIPTIEAKIHHFFEDSGTVIYSLNTKKMKYANRIQALKILCTMTRMHHRSERYLDSATKEEIEKEEPIELIIKYNNLCRHNYNVNTNHLVYCTDNLEREYLQILFNPKLFSLCWEDFCKRYGQDIDYVSHDDLWQSNILTRIKKFYVQEKPLLDEEVI